MYHSKRIAWIVIRAAALLVPLACGSDQGGAIAPQVRPLRIVSGAGVTDTIAATLAEPLTVELRDANGLPRRGVRVAFEAVPPTIPFGLPAVLVTRVATVFFFNFFADTTDADGRARVSVRLGGIAGEARVAITADDGALKDTARYTVLPGAAANITLATPDTAAYVGTPVRIVATVSDIFHNVRSGDRPTFTPATPLVSVDAAGNVTGTAIGRAAVAVRAGTGVDTFHVSIVPRGTLAVVIGGPTIATVELDGSGLRKVLSPSTFNCFPRWAPTGDRIVYHEADFASTEGHLSITDLSGTHRPLLLASGAFRFDLFGSYTGDGAWIYFSRYRTSDVGAGVFRVHPDGTGLELVTPPASSFDDSAWRPDVSPSGTTVAYVNAGSAGIRTLDVATRTVAKLDMRGEHPQFSPDGQLIAYLDAFDSAVRLMRADASAQRTVGSSGYVENGGLSFSPDGRWIVARTFEKLELINVADGSVLPLPYSSGYDQPAFRP